MKRIVSLAVVAACSDPSLGSSQQEVEQPTQSGVPASVGRLTMTGPRQSGSTHMQGCHVELIAPRWAVTAAHCFGDFFPQSAVLTVLGESIAASDVHFHPLAWGNGHTEWTQAELDDGTEPEFDVALVHLPGPSGFSIAKIWHPGTPLTALSAGQTILVTGSDRDSNQDFSPGDASGTMAFADMLAIGNGFVVETTPAPSFLEGGDSGGGDFITLDTNSLPYADHCARAPAQAGDQALIAINQSMADTAWMVPLFLSDISDWINQLTDDDIDDDGVCDADDNCKTVANSDQANCNLDAERAPKWNGAQLGDACDPTPCPAPSQTETDFVAATSGLPYVDNWGDLVFTDFGRSIQDELDVTPILADGSGPVSSTATVRFCLCRDATGAPITDLAVCAAAPYYCKLDPSQASATEIGTGVPQPGQTYWHAITTNTGFGKTIALTYPGSVVSRTWDYVTDFQTWSASGWIPALAPDPKYGPGTDLGGWLWIHDPTQVGFAAHGGLHNPADAFAPVAPDPRTTTTHVRQLPRYKPNPWWTYCAQCGDVFRFPGEQVIDPAPFVTYDPASQSTVVWTASGGHDASPYLGASLRRAFGDGSVFVGASEPAPVTRSFALPRQIQLSANGTTVLGAVIRTPTGFALSPIGAVGPSARAGFAAAWSRSAAALFIVGGVDARSGAILGQAWTWRPGGGFVLARFDAAYAPTNAEAAVFSTHDERMWIIDRTRTGRRLIRLDPVSGVVESVGPVPFADDLDGAWLTTLADGQVVMVGAFGGRYRLVRLDAPLYSRGARVVAVGRREGAGTPLGAPTVANGKIQIAIGALDGDRYVVRPVALAAP